MCLFGDPRVHNYQPPSLSSVESSTYRNTYVSVGF